MLVTSADGKEIAGRLAARPGAGLLTDVGDIKEGPVGIHSIFLAAFTVGAQVNGYTLIAGVRARAVAAELQPAAGEVVTIGVPEPAKSATVITAREAATAVVVRNQRRCRWWSLAAEQRCPKRRKRGSRRETR